eukprot:11349289-Heterocapsa_arctica.AAC.1
MKPKAGHDYLATGAHFAAESSANANMNDCTTDDFTKPTEALVFKTHKEIKGAFLTFQKDADQIQPGLKDKLGYTGAAGVGRSSRATRAGRKSYSAAARR